MSRRSFDHLHAELSVEIGRLVPRYALWIRLQELGLTPGDLARADVLHFVRDALDAFLQAEGLKLADRRRRRLERRLRRFDPAVPTPYETMERIFSGFDRRDSAPKA